MNTQGNSRLFRRLLVYICALLLFFLPFANFLQKEGGRYELTAHAASGDRMAVRAYDVEMNILPSREIEVKEVIQVEFLRSDLTMFYRSLPTDGTMYKNIQASCAGNDEFRFDVIDNPDMDGFIDVECIGGVAKGAIWTYKITYVMEQGVKSKNGMTIDVIGFGWGVDLNNVNVTVHFPAPVKTHKLYVGEFGSESDSDYTMSADGKTLYFHADLLERVHNDVYDEYMAKGVTVDFTVEKGVLKSYAESRIFTEDMWWILLGLVVTIVLTVALLIVRTKREVVTTVHIKPPDGMSPLEMGKLLDGNIDQEDIISMIYYFASKGYLKIHFESEEDITLIRCVPALPVEAPVHEKTLFAGLFKYGDRMPVTSIATDFFQTMQTIKAQVLTPKPMFERKSKFLYIFGGLLGVIYACLSCFILGRKVGGGYSYGMGLLFFIPMIVNLCMGSVRESYRYKWKPSKRNGIFIAEIVVFALVSVLFIFAFGGEHIMTEWEKAIIAIGACLPTLFVQGVLVRTEVYAKSLGDILGFKEFIIATDQEKLEFMMQENPELYYDVLPYAQVLGVSDVWEEKFQALTVYPPKYYETSDSRLTTFDCMMINRCVTRAVLQSLAAAATEAGGKVGKGGGGGSFGGFGGGGFGGGGGGAR